MAGREGVAVNRVGALGRSAHPSCAALAARLVALALVYAIVSSGGVSAVADESCLHDVPMLRDWSYTMPNTAGLASIAASPQPSVEQRVGCSSFLNASLLPNTGNVVVRISVPNGQSLIVSNCQAQSYWHVRVVLGLGANSWVTLRSWDVELGGVTVESISGGTATLENATVIVDWSSRISARSTSTTHSSSTAADDVHALSVVRPAQVNGFTLVVTNNSALNATHQGAQVLYATAAAVTSWSGVPATFVFRRVRIQISHGAAITAVSGRLSGTYTEGAARRAYAATVHVAANSNVNVTGLLLLASNSVSVTAKGEDGSAAMGLVVRGMERTSATPVATALVVRDFATVALDSRVTVTGTDNGLALTALGISASAQGATVLASNALLFAGRANISMTTPGSGYSTSALGISGNSRAVITFTRVAIYATSCDIQLTFGSYGAGVTGLGIGLNVFASVSGTFLDIYVARCVTSITSGVEGQGASLFGVAADSNSAATLGNVSIYAVETVATMTHSQGSGATIGGIAASQSSPVTVTNISTVASQCSLVLQCSAVCSSASIMGMSSAVSSTAQVTTLTAHASLSVLLLSCGSDGSGATALGMSAFSGGAISATFISFYLWQSGVTLNVASSGRGSSAVGVVASEGTSSALVYNLTMTAWRSNVTLTVGSVGKGVAAFGLAVFTATPGASATGVTGLATLSNFALTCGSAANGGAVMGTSGTTSDSDVQLRRCSSPMTGSGGGLVLISVPSAPTCQNCLVYTFPTFGGCATPSFPPIDAALADLNATAMMLLECLSRQPVFSITPPASASRTASTSPSLTKEISPSRNSVTVSGSYSSTESASASTTGESSLSRSGSEDGSSSASLTNESSISSSLSGTISASSTWGTVPASSSSSHVLSVSLSVTLPSASASRTASKSVSRTSTPSSTPSAAQSTTRSALESSSLSRSENSSVSTTPSVTASGMISASPSRTVSKSRSDTATATATSSPSASSTGLLSSTSSRTVSMAATTSHTTLQSATQSKTSTGSITHTHLPSDSVTPVLTPSMAATASRTTLPSATQSKSSTMILTQTPVSTSSTTAALTLTPQVLPHHTPPIPTNPPPITTAPNAVAKTTDTMATVLSTASMGNPAVLSQGSRLGSLRLTIECRARASQPRGTSDGLPAPPSGFDAHPLGFPIAISGNDSVNEHGGAVVGNIVIIIAFALLFLGLAALRCVLSRGSLARGMAWTRYPACIVFPVTFLLQPISLSATVLLAWGGYGIGLGVAGLLLSCILVAAGIVLYARKFPGNFIFRRHAPMHYDSRIRRFLSWLMKEKGEWAPTRVKEAEAGAPQSIIAQGEEQESMLDTVELRRFGVLFDPYDDRYAWFLAVELGYNVVQGVACGLQMSIGCMWSAWLSAGLAIVFFLLIALLQPHGRRLDVALQALLAFLQAMGAVLASAATNVDNDDLAQVLSDAAEQVVSAASMTATLLGVYEMAKAVYEQVEKRRRRRRAKRGATDGAVFFDYGAEMLLLSETSVGASHVFEEELPLPTPSPETPPPLASAPAEPKPVTRPPVPPPPPRRAAYEPPRRAAPPPQMSMLSAFEMDQLEAEGYRPLISTALPTRSGRAAPPRPAPPKHANDDLLDDILRGNEAPAPLAAGSITSVLDALLDDVPLPQPGADDLDELLGLHVPPRVAVSSALDDILLGLPDAQTVDAAQPLPLHVL
jgi:hypothetical protein